MIMHAPRTFTGEDTVEIDCHGGVYAMQRVLDTVLKNGAEIAEPGEFTKRAFLNGRMDLSQAEAVMDVIQAKNEYALRSSMDQLRGSVQKAIRDIREKLIYHIAYIESALDDPEKLAEILRGIRSKYGVYACYGNHDIQEKILAGFTFGSKEKKESTPEMDEFLEKAGITLLRDEYVLIDDSFYLYGRPDYERPGRGIDKRKTPQEITEGMDVSLPVLVIDHEPRELQELADTGVDVDLCGHTHDGQVFPGNIVIRFFWENPCGYLKKGNMHNIVTSGVGLFGPNMRVGTKSEICDVSICFN